MSGDRRLRVTHVSPFVPHRDIPHAGGQFLFHYLDRMAGRVDATLVAPGFEANRGAVEGVPPGVEVHLFPVRPPPQQPWTKALNYATNMASGLTMGLGEVEAFNRDEGARSLVAASDVLEAHWSESLPLVPTLRRLAPGAPVVAIEHDVRYQAVSVRARSAARAVDRALSRWAARRVRRLEPSLLNRCDAVLVYSDREEALLRSLGVTIPAGRIVPYIDRPSDPPGPAPDRTAAFVAAYDRPENAEGAAWLLDRVWPGVTAQVPTSRLVLAGTSPPPSLRARAEPGKVEVTGFVADLEAVYRAARVVVCPLLSGAGLKYKVPQAMAYGLPVVATLVAAEGIVESSGPDIFAAVSDDPTALTAALVACLSDRALATAVGARAREWVSAQYDFDHAVDQVLALHERLLSRKEP